MLSNLFAVILVGGLPVMWTYFMASQVGGGNFYVPGGTVKLGLWTGSMVFTVASYFILAYTFVWGTEGGTIFSRPPEEIEPFLCATYVLFLASAGQYVHHVLYDVSKGKKTWWHMLNLYSTAVFSMVICIFALAIEGIDTPLFIVSCIAGGWLVFHHLVVDAVWWYNNWTTNNLS